MGKDKEVHLEVATPKGPFSGTFPQTTKVQDVIATIVAAYKRQRDVMIAALEAHCPSEVQFTRPDGGMFLWVTLPPQLDAITLFERAVGKRVAFVPGTPFFVDGGGRHNLRLNFSNADENRIKEGISRLGRIMKEMLAGPS